MKWEEASGAQKAGAIGCAGTLFVLFLVALFTCTGGGGDSRTSSRSESVPCISSWNGQHPGFVRAVKRQLVAPDSFRHVETWYSDGAYPRTIVMKYTAKTRLGVIVDATARGTYTRDCAVEVEAIQ